MKALVTFLSLALAVSSVHADPNMTPAMRIRFALDKDSRSWVLADSLTNGSAAAVLVYTREWVPKGDSINNWKEMFDEKTILTSESISNHIATWKALLTRDDPRIEMQVKANADGTSTAIYKTVAWDEMGISRYFKGKDGIYILSYRVRPGLKDDNKLKVWQGIISSAILVHNDLSKKE